MWMEIKDKSSLGKHCLVLWSPQLKGENKEIHRLIVSCLTDRKKTKNKLYTVFIVSPVTFRLTQQINGLI